MEQAVRKQRERVEVAVATQQPPVHAGVYAMGVLGHGGDSITGSHALARAHRGSHRLVGGPQRRPARPRQRDRDHATARHSSGEGDPPRGDRAHGLSRSRREVHSPVAGRPLCRRRIPWSPHQRPGGPGSAGDGPCAGERVRALCLNRALSPAPFPRVCRSRCRQRQCDQGQQQGSHPQTKERASGPRAGARLRRGAPSRHRALPPSLGPGRGPARGRCVVGAGP